MLCLSGFKLYSRWVPLNPEPLRPSSKNNESYIENAWAFVLATVNLKTEPKSLYYS